MSNQLILMRHAKSDHDDPELSDHDRPLNPRGRHDSPRMARWLAEQDRIPDLILCSSAQRTCETAELMMDCWEDSPELVTCESLYLASPDSMLWTLKSEHRDFNRIMLLAHNPGISMMSSMLSGQSLVMPTAAIAIFDCQEESNQDGAAEGQDRVFERLSSRAEVTLTHFMRPKELKD